MKLSKFKSLIIFLVVFIFSENSNAQCFEIESILVDACSSSGPEGKNEMVRFKVGSSAINTSSMSVSWPNNSWQGLIQNATTSVSVAQLNSQVVASGGCGTIIQPTLGVLPANATVVLVTSHEFEVNSNFFGAITEDIYIIFQNNPTTTSGHFANYNSSQGLRTLSINFGSCSDSVTYERSFLVGSSGSPSAEDGATVNFTASGTATYTNNGCQAPVQVSSIDAGNGNSPMTVCQGSTISLNGSGVGIVTSTWSASAGTFSSANSLNSNYTLSPTSTGTITLTLTGYGACGNPLTDTVLINITSSITPTFSFATNLCVSGTIPILPLVSDNGINGTWNQTTITTTGDYVFTPNNTSQCGIAVTIPVTVSSSITPTFSFATSLCVSGTIPTLPLVSDNGINGTWNQTTITTTGDYVFTPNNASQCGIAVTIPVTVSSSITPTFSFATNLCVSGTIPMLPLVSDNGINGTWSQTTITTTGDYVFTPNDLCSEVTSVQITVKGCVIPKGVSPNNDGSNDTWDLTNFDINNVDIFNRYGVKVFSKSNYTNEWHGQSDNDNELPTGTYYYLIHLNDASVKTGWVYINR